MKNKISNLFQIRHLFYAMLVAVLAGCSDNEKPVEKPFIVVNKFVNYSSVEKTCIYYYQDKNGKQEEFRDWNDKYNVGDTLK